VKLYHYNSKVLDSILTRDLQGVVTDKERKDGVDGAKFRGDMGPYFESVSFLLEPAPLDILGDIFDKDHHTWRSGNNLVEHVVELSGQNFYGWVIVEGPISMAFIDHVPWTENDLGKKLYFKSLKIGRKLFGESGSDYKSLVKALEKFPAGTTREAYRNLPKRKDYAKIKGMYAATVPHLMIYTKTPIEVASTQNVSVESYVETKPPSSKW